ncbi:HEPN domain-containing protein [Larkinella terrae]|uniref:Apea-like HEPN domain-containing protein n=1 Tax=Larkinella terrae TaxID=2025311 RepID=A0A7K0EUH5_9BACT|nr:HEPN domain-containing protein [Larkinella terrae]MRS65098.1 hypothetical protein [Larkinella terrae]
METVEINDFIFLLNAYRISSDIKLPFLITENYYLERASEKQVHVIKEKLIEHTAYFKQYIAFHEISFTLNQYNENPFRFGKELDNQNWNYYIIASRNIKDLDQRFDLRVCCHLYNNLLMGPEFSFTSSEISNPFFDFDPLVLASYYEFLSLDIMKYNIEITLSMLQGIGDSYKRLKDLMSNSRESYQLIKMAIYNYYNTSKTPNQSQYKFLEFMSIFEFLLTEDTNGRGNPISRQLPAKIHLLNNRFSQSIDLKKYFDNPETPIKTFIEKLYSLRSDIAHGNIIKFKDSKIESLKNVYTAKLFANDLLSKTLIHSLIEPKLILDLKKC